MTPRALITRALRKAGVNGVGQAAGAIDLQDALDDLNDMFGQWQRRRWLVTDLVEVVFSSTGKHVYSVGPDVRSDVIMARPDQLTDAFLRLSPTVGNPIDYPLKVLRSQEDYNAISLKSQTGLTSEIFYDPSFPSGKLFVWPTPPANGTTEFHLFFKNQSFLTLGLDDNINLPPEYGEAMLYNLAARLRPAYQLPPDGSVIALAISALATIRKANIQVPELGMPGGLPGQTMRGGIASGLGYAGNGGGGPGIFRVDISLLDGPDTLDGGPGSIVIPGSGVPSITIPGGSGGGSGGGSSGGNTGFFRVDFSFLDGSDVLA